MQTWDRDEVEDIELALAERLEGWLAPGERVAVRGSSGGGEVEAAFVLEGGPRGERLDLAARVELGSTRLGADEARDLCLDALDLLLLEYLESERSIRYSGVEEERELRGHALRVRVERTFPGIEAQADALLAKERER